MRAELGLHFGINYPTTALCGLQEFIDNGKGGVAGVKTVLVDWQKDATGRWKMEEMPGTVLLMLFMLLRVQLTSGFGGCFQMLVKLSFLPDRY